MYQAAQRNPTTNTGGGSGSRPYSTNASQARSGNRPPFQRKPQPPSPFETYSYEKQSPGTRLVYIRDAAKADEEIAKLGLGPLGFDLEWRPNFIKGRKENPVALVQIASKDVILLIQVSAIGSFPEGLKSLLNDPGIVKAGVGIQGDCKKLWADWRVNSRHCVDLALLARSVDNARWKGSYTNPIGLARLCEAYFQRSLHKGKITRSNWEADLTFAQQTYAANDAHSGLTIYNHLSSMLASTSPRPLPEYFSFDLLFGYLYHLSQIEHNKLWQPRNPYYDPGPPPERKERPALEERDGTLDTPRRNNDATSATTTQNPRHNKPRNKRGRKAGSGDTLVTYLSGGVRLGTQVVGSS